MIRFKVLFCFYNITNETGVLTNNLVKNPKMCFKVRWRVSKIEFLDNGFQKIFDSINKINQKINQVFRI